MASRSYDGDPVDATVQYIGEAPHWDDDRDVLDGEVVDATGEPEGELRAEGVPDVGSVQEPDEPGQSTLDDWGWRR